MYRRVTCSWIQQIENTRRMHMKYIRREEAFVIVGEGYTQTHTHTHTEENMCWSKYVRASKNCDLYTASVIHLSSVNALSYMKSRRNTMATRVLRPLNDRDTIGEKTMAKPFSLQERKPTPRWTYTHTHTHTQKFTHTWAILVLQLS